MRSPVLKYIHEQGLFHPGNRVAVAVSGGPDSVALLRVLLELREELGLVLFVVHVHHGIRGSEADADCEFVRNLAEQYGLEFFEGKADAPGLAKQHGLTLEEAARTLRYALFADIAQRHRLDSIATGHSRDDQAETVLMKFLRGAGSKGLSGIFPTHDLPNSQARVVRPLLCVRRKEIERYLQELGQQWREDAMNKDSHHTRNRVRSNLLPLLESEFNPAVVQTLSNMADISRAEEEYWSAELRRVLPLVLLPGKPVRGGGRAVETSGEKTVSLDFDAVKRYPLALQRRIIRAAAEQASAHLDFEHVLAVEKLLSASHQNAEIELPEGYIARRGYRELRFERARSLRNKKFAYDLTVPGSLSVPELGTAIRTSLDNRSISPEEYNQRHLIKLNHDEMRLIVRPWHAGDRFRPAHTGSEKKLKELLQPLHLPPEQRALWPVVTAGEKIIWVRGYDSPPISVHSSGENKRLLIDEVALSNQQTK